MNYHPNHQKNASEANATGPDINLVTKNKNKRIKAFYKLQTTPSCLGFEISLSHPATKLDSRVGN